MINTYLVTCKNLINTSILTAMLLHISVKIFIVMFLINFTHVSGKLSSPEINSYIYIVFNLI